MNVANTIELLKTGIPEESLNIPKGLLGSLKRHLLISSMDILPGTGNYNVEGAVKLHLYSMVKRMGIGFTYILAIEKKYRAERLYAKKLNFHGYEHSATIFTKPILFTLADKRHYISINPAEGEIDFLTDEDYIMSISYGKHTADHIHGRVIFDLWEILELLGFEKPKKSKGMISSLNKIFEKNRFPVRQGKYHYIETTEYYDKPKKLGKSIVSVMSEPQTFMTLSSNNHGYITSIVVKKRKRVENSTE